MSQERQVSVDGSDRVESDVYDPHIVPAETAARMEREGGKYKATPTEEGEAAEPTDDQTDPESIHTTDGYTVDKEGLLNNYAIEPEMYYEVPGDARQAEAELHEERVEEYHDMNQDEKGKLTMDGDQRGHGSGAV